MSPEPVQFETHAPERRKRPSTVTAACGCCCCCCCLHTIGGLIGAAAAPVFGSAGTATPFHYDVDDFDAELPPLTRPGPSAIAVYWTTFLIMTAISLLIALVNGVVGVVILLLVLPMVQLGAVFVSLVLLALSPGSIASGQLWQLGKIAIGLVVGTILGVASMFGLAGLMGAFR